MTTRAIVVDIEGTTSSTVSVHVDLYDYARPRLGPWIEAHADDDEVAAAVAATKADAGLAPGAATTDVVAALHAWMDADVKATPLKTLQGQIWAAGFRQANWPVTSSLTSPRGFATGMPKVLPSLSTRRDRSPANELGSNTRMREI